MKSKQNYYYDVKEDLKNGCWLNMIIGGRNTGKTYSTLKYCYENNIIFGFVKRTNNDVKLLCTSDDTTNFSPFNAINRDLGCNIKPKTLLSEKIGGFYHVNDDGDFEGSPIGYILSLNAVGDIKGFEFPQRMDILIFDEFIPQPWERINRREGEQFMDLYRTIARDREHRGYGALIAVMLANAVRISNPIMNFFEVVDNFANMQMQDADFEILEDRGILLHLLKNSIEFDNVEHNSIVYQAMNQTAWGAMAYGNTFGYDDLTNVHPIRLKGYKPVVSVHYKTYDFYIYMKDGEYQMCKNRNDIAKVYNLNRENEQKAFFRDHVYDLREACIDDKMYFETYTMYDLIINYKKIFQIS